jgi:hypothetical protein
MSPDPRELVAQPRLSSQAGHMAFTCSGAVSLHTADAKRPYSSEEVSTHGSEFSRVGLPRQPVLLCTEVFTASLQPG